MALNPRSQVQGRTLDRTYTGELDAGLRAYMLRVYNYMAMGVALTGIVAYAVALNPQLMQTIALGGFKWVLFAAILGLGWFSGRIIFSASPTMAHGAYWLYAGLWGALISPMIYAYTGESIARVFFITAAAFAGTGVGTPVERPWSTHVYHLYVVRVPHRASLERTLAERKIGHAVYYPLPLHRTALFKASSPDTFPVSDRLSQELLAIPLYPEMSDEQQSAVVSAVREAVLAAR